MHKKTANKIRDFVDNLMSYRQYITLGITSPKDFSIVLAVAYADSSRNSTRRRPQAKAVPAESVHKKTANKIRDFVDSLKAPNKCLFIH